MNSAEYEVTKQYAVSGAEVCSEVTKDEETDEYRAFHLRTSCQSHRWGVRTLGFSITCYKRAGSENALDILEKNRIKEAERIVKIESGELPETGPVFLATQIEGSNGKTLNALSAADLSLSPSLMSKEIIEFLALELLKKTTFQEDIIASPLFKATIRYGSWKVETMIAPSEHGSPAVILGGDFFQRALRGKEHLITELVLPDHQRALASAARCKKRFVLIAGKYGDYRIRLERIKRALATQDFVGLILDEYPDIEEQSLSEKMVVFASICRFVIVDDLVPSGHIDELGICRERRFVTAILRSGGKASTAMQADITDEILFMKGFSYEGDDQFETKVLEAAKWANEAVSERAVRLNRTYSDWRGANKVQRAEAGQSSN